MHHTILGFWLQEDLQTSQYSKIIVRFQRWKTNLILPNHHWSGAQSWKWVDKKVPGMHIRIAAITVKSVTCFRGDFCFPMNTLLTTRSSKTSIKLKDHQMPFWISAYDSGKKQKNISVVKTSMMTGFIEESCLFVHWLRNESAYEKKCFAHQIRYQRYLVLATKFRPARWMTRKLSWSQT